MIEGDSLQDRVRSAFKLHVVKRDAMRDGYRLKSFPVSADHMRAHDCCDFDQWLDRERRITGDDEHLHRIASSHRAFHESAASVIAAVNGNAAKPIIDEAWRRYMRDGMDLGNELSAWLREIS